MAYSDNTLTHYDDDHHRSRRDTELQPTPTNTTTTTTDTSEEPQPDIPIDLTPSASDSIRTPRQLRPPSLAPSSWLQYENHDSLQHRNTKSYQPNRFGSNARYIQSQPHSTSATRFLKSDAVIAQSSIKNKEYNPVFNSFTKGNSVSDGTKTFPNFPRQTDDEFQPSQRLKEYDYFPQAINQQYKTSTTKAPFHQQHLPLYLGGKKPFKSDDNYPFFNIAAKNKIPNVAVLPNATPKSHFVQFSTVAGFYNNQPTTTLSPLMDAYKQYNKYRAVNTAITPAPVYEHNDSSGSVYFSKNYFPTIAAQSSSEFTTTRPQTYYPPTMTTTARIQPDMTSGNYYHNSVGISQHPSSQFNYNFATTSETPIGHFITESTYQPGRPTVPTSYASSGGTIGPVVGIDFDFDKFIERIRSGQSAKPTSAGSSVRNSTILSAVDSTTSTTTKPIKDWPLTTGVIATKSTPRPFIHLKVSRD